MKTITRVLAVILVLAVVAVVGYRLWQQRSGSTTTAQTETFTQVVPVQEGDLQASIDVVGELYAPQNQEMRFERLAGAAYLTAVETEAGHVVRAGQPLATIDATSYQQALDQARSELQEAEQKLSDLQTPATDLEKAQADLKIAQAEVALQQARQNLDDLRNPDLADLRATVGDAQLKLAQAQESLTAAQPDQSAQDRLATLQDKEAEQYAVYKRLAAETYSDTFYQDRLRLAHNAFLTAQDSRITSELQQQVSLLRAQMQVRQAEATLASAQEALADALAGASALDLALAEHAVAQAQADLTAAQEARAELETGADAVKLAAAQADLDKKRLAVSEAEADLTAATLLAPFDGTVLEVNAEAGDRIIAASTILTLANLDQLQVVASVDETTIRQVQQGQQAIVSFDAFPGRSFHGQVLSVPLQGSLQGGVMVYEVPLSLDDAGDLPLLVGMTANVSIETGRVENALLVPTLALQTVNGMYQVLVANPADPDGQPVATPVEVGLSNGTYTQIVKGLVAGDQIVYQLANSQSNQPGFGAIRAFEGGGPPPGGARPPD
ncbi:MAG: efflux RND transporter periplasmic adaptor subunit [Caldilineales bacterium]|nr:efflux RND transporter periplasmic adaptor subunit [Caldilineales bacterium]